MLVEASEEWSCGDIGDKKARPVKLSGRGLKVPFDLLVKVATVQFAFEVNDGIVLAGYQTALILTKV